MWPAPQCCHTSSRASPSATGLHDDSRDVDVGLDRLVGQDAASVDVDLIADGDVVTKNSHVLETCPLADGAVPPDNRLPDQGVVLDPGSLQDDTLLQPNAVANDNVRSNGDMGADLAVVTDLG